MLADVDYHELTSLLTRFFAGEATLQTQLFEIQKSPLAWELPGRLLQENDPSLRFFGASTVSIKISRDFDSLDPQNVMPLKASLLEWLAASCRLAYPQHPPAVTSERVVVRKLAVAVRSVPTALPSMMRIAGPDCEPDPEAACLGRVAELDARAHVLPFGAFL
jgi:hypothetical protein